MFSEKLFSTRCDHIAFMASMVFFFSLFSVQAETSSNHIISGTLTAESNDVFMSVLKSKKVDTVVFKDCDGGNSAAGLMIAKTIKDNAIKTIASGRVISACAFAYLGGVTREIDLSANNTVIKFHGGMNIKTGEPASLAINQSMLKLLFEFTNFKFNKTIEDIILNTKSDDEGAFFARVQESGKIRNVTTYCPVGSNMKPEKCKKLDGLTLESEGIVTK